MGLIYRVPLARGQVLWLAYKKLVWIILEYTYVLIWRYGLAAPFDSFMTVVLKRR